MSPHSLSQRSSGIRQIEHSVRRPSKTSVVFSASLLSNFRSTVNKPLFYRKDPDTGQWITKSPACWRPDGMMSDALSYHQYKNELGEHVSGWNWGARRNRAKTLLHGLHNAPELVQDSPVSESNPTSQNTEVTAEQEEGGSGAIPKSDQSLTRPQDPA